MVCFYILQMLLHFKSNIIYFPWYVLFYDYIFSFKLKHSIARKFVLLLGNGPQKYYEYVLPKLKFDYFYSLVKT